MRSAARLFRAGDGSFLTSKGSNIFEWRLAELPFAWPLSGQIKRRRASTVRDVA